MRLAEALRAAGKTDVPTGLWSRAGDQPAARVRAARAGWPVDHARRWRDCSRSAVAMLRHRSGRAEAWDTLGLALMLTGECRSRNRHLPKRSAFRRRRRVCAAPVDAQLPARGRRCWLGSKSRETIRSTVLQTARGICSNGWPAARGDRRAGDSDRARADAPLPAALSRPLARANRLREAEAVLRQCSGPIRTTLSPTDARVVVPACIVMPSPEELLDLIERSRERA